MCGADVTSATAAAAAVGLWCAGERACALRGRCGSGLWCQGGDGRHKRPPRPQGRVSLAPARTRSASGRKLPGPALLSTAPRHLHEPGARHPWPWAGPHAPIAPSGCTAPCPAPHPPNHPRPRRSYPPQLSPLFRVRLPSCAGPSRITGRPPHARMNKCPCGARGGGWRKDLERRCLP